MAWRGLPRLCNQLHACGAPIRRCQLHGAPGLLAPFSSAAPSPNPKQRQLSTGLKIAAAAAIIGATVTTFYPSAYRPPSLPVEPKVRPRLSFRLAGDCVPSCCAQLATLLTERLRVTHTNTAVQSRRGTARLISLARAHPRLT